MERCPARLPYAATIRLRDVPSTDLDWFFGGSAAGRSLDAHLPKLRACASRSSRPVLPLPAELGQGKPAGARLACWPRHRTSPSQRAWAWSQRRCGGWRLRTEGHDRRTHELGSYRHLSNLAITSSGVTFDATRYSAAQRREMAEWSDSEWVSP